MRSIHLLPASGVLLLLVSLSSAADPIAAASAEELRQQAAELRIALAQARLDLRRTQLQIEEVRAFMEAGHPEEDILRWQKQRELMADERARLTEERQRFLKLRQNVRDAAQQSAGSVSRAGGSAPVANPASPNPQIEYKVALIPLTDARSPIFMEPRSGGVLLAHFSDVDHRNLLLRGNIQNRSSAAWRYTFEIRIADRSGALIGRWRYQTPHLGPNELHNFEVKVPVTEVAQIYTYQIGNIESDQAAAPVPAPAAPAPKP